VVYHNSKNENEIYGYSPALGREKTNQKRILYSGSHADGNNSVCLELNLKSIEYSPSAGERTSRDI
jgi:hypothetical protein